METKRCCRCRKLLPCDDFWRNRRTKDGLQSRCKDCHRAGIPEAPNLRRKFGITEEQYQEMLATQRGVCWICHEGPGKRRLSVDHDHACCPGSTTCGKCIRGLLCGRCNAAIGMLREDLERFYWAMQYIERSRMAQERR